MVNGSDHAPAPAGHEAQTEEAPELDQRPFGGRGEMLDIPLDVRPDGDGLEESLIGRPQYQQTTDGIRKLATLYREPASTELF